MGSPAALPKPRVRFSKRGSVRYGLLRLRGKAWYLWGRVFSSSTGNPLCDHALHATRTPGPLMLDSPFAGASQSRRAIKTEVQITQKKARVARASCLVVGQNWLLCDVDGLAGHVFGKSPLKAPFSGHEG